MEHQVKDVLWIDREKRGLLGNEPGLGKTKSAIDATDGAKTLVVAPAMVINSGTWTRELERWSAYPENYTIVPYTSLAQRVKTGNGSGTVPLAVAKSQYRQPWEAVILDESHYMKGRDTHWTKIIRNLARNASLVMPMTGTPVPNWSHELFTTLQLLNPEESQPGGRFGSFWRWAEEWFDCSPNKYSDGKPVAGDMLACTPRCSLRPWNDPCEHYLNFTATNLGSKYRRVLRKDVLDLPLVTEQEVETPMDPAARRFYNRLKRDFAATYDGTDVITWSQGALNVAIDKCTVSPWILTSEGAARGGKLDQLALDLTGRSRATLVLAHYRDVVEACHQVAVGIGARSAYIHGGVGSRVAVREFERFHAGELDVLVGSLDTLAEGHTLTEADMMIFVEKSWKTYRNEQARFRVDRIGQTRPVTIKDYITPKSVDSNKRRILKLKTEDQIRTMTAAEFTALL